MKHNMILLPAAALAILLSSRCTESHCVNAADTAAAVNNETCMSSSGGVVQARKIFPEKAFYLPFNFTKTEELFKITQMADRAKKAGYNTVYLSDAKFGNPWQRGAQYEKNLKDAVKILRDRNLKVVIYVCAHGQFLEEFPFEVECVPVQEQEMRGVKGRITGENLFSNSSFEEGVEGWIPDKGKDISIDSTVSASGKNSLHFRLDPKKRGQIRVQRSLPKGPFKQYTLSLKLKTSGLKGGTVSALPVGLVRNGKSEKEYRYCWHQRLNAVKPIKPTQDWEEYTFSFSTLDEEEITLFIGSWGATEGDFWIDDVELRAASFPNIVRRDDMPLVITSADKKIHYEEGRDFSPVSDPLCGNYRWKGRFDFTHPGPVVTIPAGSRIKEGEKLLVSYHHAFAGDSQKPDFCLNSPVLKKLVARQIRWFQEKIDPEGYLIAIDEYRCYGYDPNCVKSGRKAGEALRELACFTYDEIKKIAPGRTIYMWNDMFDPYGNCREDGFYYAVRGRGSLWNSWAGLPKDIIILRWQCEDLESVKNAMAHWGGLGMKYIQFPTYFTDEFSPLVRPVIEMAAKDPNCIGIGFAQWRGIDNFKPYFEKMLEVVDEVVRSQDTAK